MEKLPPPTGFTILQPAQITRQARTHPLILILHSRQQTAQLLELAAYLGQRGALLVLDGGNCFNGYSVAAALYRMQGSGSIRPVLERIRVARAFTCYQMGELIRAALPYSTRPPHPQLPEEEGTPGGQEGQGQAEGSVRAAVVLDLLATFLDENVPLGERKRLLRSCLDDLKKLAHSAPVLMTVRQSSSHPIPPEMLTSLLEAAGEVWSAPQPEPPPANLRLFAE